MTTAINIGNYLLSKGTCEYHILIYCLHIIESFLHHTEYGTSNSIRIIMKIVQKIEIPLRQKPFSIPHPLRLATGQLRFLVLLPVL